MILFHMLDTLYLSSCFLSIALIHYTSSHRQILLGSTNNARDQHEYRHKIGKIGPSHLLSERGDLSLSLYFSKQCLVENIQRKPSVNLICASLLCTIFASLARANECVHDSEINACFLLNEHGNLYFLLHNNSVHIILLNEKKGKVIGRKKGIGERVQKSVSLECKL